MGKLDYKLRHILCSDANGAPLDLYKATVEQPLTAETAAESSVEKAEAKKEQERIRILLHFTDGSEGLNNIIRDLNFEKTSSIGDIAAGWITFDKLRALENHKNVISVSHSRLLKYAIDRSLVAVGMANLRTQLNSMRFASNGRGVIVGVIESGLDYTHPCFCDENGHTRILYVWHQTEETGNKSPKPFNYGVEYKKADIDKKLQESNLQSIFPPDAIFHGTHVTGIAAGNGLARPQNKFVGIAPEADIILVAYNANGQFADSAFVVDAFEYLFQRAKEEKKPLVINLSQGDNFGSHDGTSLLEKAIDNLLENPGVFVVNSAGNERDKNTHAKGKVLEKREYRLEFDVSPGDTEEDVFDIWYKHGDRFSVGLQTPDGERTELISVDNQDKFAEKIFRFNKNKNEAYIFSQIDHPENSDNRINIVLRRGKESTIKEGRWRIIFFGDEIKEGEGSFHAWIDNSKDFTSPQFIKPDNSCTVAVPGTSKAIITVGAYITRLKPDENSFFIVGDLGPGSAAGPTRDNRNKPDITAPGHWIRSSTPFDFRTTYDLQSGTSMAAPHVTGVIAVLLGINPEKALSLMQEQLKSILTESAFIDSFTSTTPNFDWGHGKLYAEDAYKKFTALFNS